MTRPEFIDGGTDTKTERDRATDACPAPDDDWCPGCEGTGIGSDTGHCPECGGTGSRAHATGTRVAATEGGHASALGCPDQSSPRPGERLIAGFLYNVGAEKPDTWAEGIVALLSVRGLEIVPKDGRE